MFAVAWSLPANAIVNVENMRVQSPPAGFSGKLEAAVDLQSGNTKRIRTNAGTRLQWKHDNRLDFLVFNYDYGQNSGVPDTNKGFLHGRHVVTLNPQWAREYYAQVQQDEFRQLTFRGLLGGGLRRTLLRKPQRTAVFLGLGAFYENENLVSGTTDRLWRGNFYVSAKHAVSAEISLISTTYYQPALNTIDDFRMSEQAAAIVALTKKLDLKISLSVSHDGQPPAGVEATDISFRTGIEYRF